MICRQHGILAQICATSRLESNRRDIILTEKMNAQTASRVSALMGFLAVALGAFGAHAIKGLLARNGMAGVWETAVFYHFIHAVMLFVLADRRPSVSGPWWCFFLGIILFSGSLYLLAATNTRWLGGITPVGGLSFLLGWGWLLCKPSAPRV